MALSGQRSRTSKTKGTRLKRWIRSIPSPMNRGGDEQSRTDGRSSFRYPHALEIANERYERARLMKVLLARSGTYMR